MILTMSAKVKTSIILLIKGTLLFLSLILTRRKGKSKRKRLKMLLKRFHPQLKANQRRIQHMLTTKILQVMRSSTELEVLKTVIILKPKARARVQHQMIKYLESLIHKIQREVVELFNDQS